MKQFTLLAYIYEFISILMENEGMFKSIDKIILFGSVARGDFDKNSDVDLFIGVKPLDKINLVEKALQEAIAIFEMKSKNTWYLRGINLPIKPICGRLEEKVWEDLEKEIISTGIVMYGRYEKNPKNLKQYILISYKLTKLKQHKKMQFIRCMYGYKTKKNKKVYKQKGILNSIDGEKLTTNQIIIKINDIKKVTDTLKEFKIPYTIKEVWVTK